MSSGLFYISRNLVSTQVLDYFFFCIFLQSIRSVCSILSWPLGLKRAWSRGRTIFISSFQPKSPLPLVPFANLPNWPFFFNRWVSPPWIVKAVPPSGRGLLHSGVGWVESKNSGAIAKLTENHEWDFYWTTIWFGLVSFPLCGLLFHCLVIYCLWSKHKKKVSGKDTQKRMKSKSQLKDLSGKKVYAHVLGSGIPTNSCQSKSKTTNNPKSAQMTPKQPQIIMNEIFSFLWRINFLQEKKTPKVP